MIISKLLRTQKRRSYSTTDEAQTLVNDGLNEALDWGPTGTSVGR